MKAWKLKRSKPRKADGNTSFDNELPDKKGMPPAREVLPPSAMVKSRSLESLRDAISSSQEEVTSNSNMPAEVPYICLFNQCYNLFCIKMLVILY